MMKVSAEPAAVAEEAAGLITSDLLGQSYHVARERVIAGLFASATQGFQSDTDHGG